MKDKTPKDRLGLYFTTKEDTSYKTSLTVSCTVMHERKRDNGGTEWQWCGSLDFAEYDSLVLHGYVWSDQTADAWPQFDLRYESLYCVDLRDAERHYKTLKRLTTAWDKLKEREGNPRTMGQAANQFARIIGADVMVESRDAQSKAATGERFRFYDRLGEGGQAIDHLIYTWLQKMNPKPQVAESEAV